MSDVTKLLDQILTLMCEQDASDVYIKADAQPHLRIQGDLVAINVDPFTPAMTEQMALEIMPELHRAGFLKRPEANFMYVMKGANERFRTNVYLQRGTYAMVMRRVREDIRSFEELGLPSVLSDLVMEKRGMVLLTGPTGSGKSTTLAAMIDYRNTNSGGHIITIEDPIEFVHKDKRSILSMREVGFDTMSFNDSLESALRQAPDVLLVGEMRDVASVKAAVAFAETGHLVLSTLHSNNAVQTIERIMQFFPPDMHESVCHMLSLNLKAVVSQRLIPRKDGEGRCAAIEIMINNARMQDLLKRMEVNTIKRELDLFLPEGMRSFDHSLLELYKAGQISAQDAILHSDKPSDMKLKIKTLPDYIRSSPRDDERYREESLKEAQMRQQREKEAMEQAEAAEQAAKAEASEQA